MTDLEVIKNLSKWLDFMGLQLDAAWGNIDGPEFEERASEFLEDKELHTFMDSWDRDLRYMHHDYEEESDA